MGERIALLSVYDKDGIVEFARGLEKLGFKLLSTGGTAAALRASGVEVTDVSSVTGYPEVLGGRVKTLHPAIHAGILARPTKEHMDELESLGVDPIEVVAVNLYPFGATVERGAGHAQAVENIDIGGPTMIRAAAKNYERVTVIVNPARYGQVIEELSSAGSVSGDTRFSLAAEAFAHTAAYDGAIAHYFAGIRSAAASASASTSTSDAFASGGAGAANDVASPEALAPEFTLAGTRVQTMRYGENPHQRAAFYRLSGEVPAGLAAARQLAGKELSFNNVADADAAIRIVREYDEPAVVIVKHANPCGVGIGTNLADAYRAALDSDPVSAFGGIVAANRPIDGETAALMAHLFLEVVAAPGFSPEAIGELTARHNLRLVDLSGSGWDTVTGLDVKPVLGGFLVQQSDSVVDDHAAFNVVTDRAPSAEETAALLNAWKVSAHVKSNAIVLWKGDGTVGVGAGQMNRVGSAQIAIGTAGEKARGSVLASDGFFPFGDTVAQAAAAGITAIIQPGGSVRDRESIDAANASGIAMVFTGVRHFKH